MNKMKAKTVKPMKGMVPAGYADGGKVMPFKGKQTKAEEMAEAKAVRAGKMTPKQYASKEMAEEKKMGVKKPSKSALMEKGKALATGKMSAKEYASKGK